MSDWEKKAEGIRERWVEADDKLVFQKEQDVKAIIDDCQRRSNEGLHGHADMRHVMRVPEVVIDHYCHINGITLQEFIGNSEHIKRLANSPEFSLLRIWKGTI